MSPFLYPLKTPGNQKASSVFRGYNIGIMTKKGLIKFIIARWGSAQEILFLLACCFMRPSRGRGEVYKKSGYNEELIDKMVQLLGKYCSFG